ncbi:hypothetical protein ACWT_6835 [Actinoplanes sp. SE50]|uniref:DUF4352 domain-containing protein n=1 Tax=unclassified Actinoplanes TaxID=2626549 RepID=UPI00023ED326|nr:MULTISPECIES: DUF4352 domain-containing protein [unclassified Actinoplanes]AEV87848.1 hypothetical protein ACPL_6966 [Actinoplanes sp. SE50/110]ATO86250.1 hypothetical protein ACWT_6835 [Actinoplanes sp. SE50]SLM03665.1 hypothetical protein ACSP50_6961 [Actinoplanes sp. SE50/110]
MTAPGQTADTSSTCPSCGAAMEVAHDAGVMRCPYCRRESPLPGAQTGWPFGAGATGMPRITVSTRPLLTPDLVRRQKKIAWIAGGGMLVFLLIVMVPIFSSFSHSAADYSYQPPEKKVQEVAIGATAQVKGFEATVRSVDCTKQSMTRTADDPATSWDESDVIKAEGKFCVIAFSAKNVGARTDTYPTFDLEASSPTERVFSRNTSAEWYLNKNTDDLSKPIDPGKTVDSFLVYDVPTDSKFAYLRLSDGILSDTIVKVKIDK